MKKFKYRFSPLIWVLLSLAMLIAVCTTIINVLQIIDYANKGLQIDYTKIIVIFIAILFFAFIIVVIVNSNYEITQTELKTRLGFIVTGVKLKDIQEIVLFVKDKRLSVIFKDEEFTNIVISPLLYNDFIKSIKATAPHIIYTPYEENSTNTEN